MAGIGFELKKLFSKKGLFALIRAYGYAGVVCTGSMLLGMVLLLGIQAIAKFGGVAKAEQELLVCMITYTLLASLFITNLLSMVTTRYAADMLYSKEDSRIMPSFYGSLTVVLGIGGLVYGVFLLISGVEVEYKLCCLILFMELVVVWTQINYLTAVKDYKGILITFLVSVASALLVGYVLVMVGASAIISLLLSVILAYGIMMVWYYCLLVEYFPKGKGNPLDFLR